MTSEFSKGRPKLKKRKIEKGGTSDREKRRVKKSRFRQKRANAPRKGLGNEAEKEWPIRIFFKAIFSFTGIRGKSPTLKGETVRRELKREEHKAWIRMKSKQGPAAADDFGCWGKNSATRKGKRRWVGRRVCSSKNLVRKPGRPVSGKRGRLALCHLQGPALKKIFVAV